MRNSAKIKNNLFLVLLFFLFWSLNFLYWMEDNSLPIRDEANHIRIAWGYRKGWDLPLHPAHGPLFYWISYPFLSSSFPFLPFANIIFSIFLFLAFFIMGEKLLKDSFFPLYLLLTFPVVFSLSRMFLLDFSLLCLVAFSISLLFLESKWAYVGFYFSSLAGYLLKLSFPLYVFPPLLYLGRKRKKFFVLFFLATISALPFYLPKISGILNTVIMPGTSHLSSPLKKLHEELISFILQLKELVGTVYLLPFLILLSFYLPRLKNRFLYSLSFFFPLFFIFLFSYTEVRYVLPVLIWLALVIAESVTVPSSLSRKFITSLLILAGLLQFLILSFYPWEDRLPSSFTPHNTWIIHSTRSESFPVEEILNSLIRLTKGKDAVIGVMGQTMELGPDLLWLIASLKDFPYEFVEVERGNLKEHPEISFILLIRESEEGLPHYLKFPQETFIHFKTLSWGNTKVGFFKKIIQVYN
ncbi:hypothetical protein J7K56_02035 [Candidatus Calescamantes bacterium]|nr:hypothetical protein [Candidatus Calescamantes bacterium]